MKLKNEFITQSFGDESLLVPTGAAEFSGIVKGNKTLGAILECLKQETSEDDIVLSLKERYDAPEDVIRRDVEKVINELRKIGALDE